MAEQCYTTSLLPQRRGGLRPTEAVREDRKGAIANMGLQAPSPTINHCGEAISQRPAIGPRGHQLWSLNPISLTTMEPGPSDLEMP